MEQAKKSADFIKIQIHVRVQSTELHKHDYGSNS